MTDNKNETAAPKTEAVKAAAAPAVKAIDAATTVAKAAVEAPAAVARTAAAAAKAPRAAKRAKAAKPARRVAAKAKARKARTVKAPTAAARKASARIATTTRTVRNNVNKGTQTMKNEANQVAERVQAVFGDVNARAKTAIERNSRFAEEMTELTKGNVEAIVASTKVAAKGVETMGQEVAEFGRKSFEDASAAFKGWADVKSPTDLFRLQGDFARTQFDSVVAESSKLSETMIKLAGDMFAPITNRYSVAAERVKSAVAL